MEPASLCAQGGPLDGSKPNKALWLASVNEFSSVAEYYEADFFYRRYGSPNVKQLGEAVAALEEAEAGLATSTGMGAILVALLAVCQRGDTVVAPRDPYGGSYDLLSGDMEHRFGIHVVLEDVHNLVKLDSTLCQLKETSGSDRITVFVETISNPLLKVADIPELARLCKQYGCLFIVDNTFATPLRSRPLKQGADLVVHSATKFLGGHGDAMAGAVVGASEYVNCAAGLVGRWGLAASPLDAWLVLRGIRTLQVRMERSWSTASALAQRLLSHGWKVMSTTSCSVVAFEVHGGLSGVEAALGRFKLIKLSPSLGGTNTTVSHSATSSHKSLSREQRAALGIGDGLLRMSVGLESVDDIWADLEHGLGI